MCILTAFDWSITLVIMQMIAASEFKAKCLALIDDVGTRGGRVVISKRGKPVAELIRYTEVESGYSQETLRNSVSIVGEIESPVVPIADWNRPG